jgi:uncharacterized membrane protein
LRIEARDLVLASVFAALYVVINVVQMVSVGNPTIYGPVQLRLADCLIPLVALLGWPIGVGVTLGCFLTNGYYFLGVQDVVFGPIANLVAAMVILILRRHRFAACVLGALPIGLIVGSYLWLVFGFQPPQVLSVLSPWAAMVVSLTISSLIVMAGIGYLLLSVLSRKGFIEPLKSMGLKVVTEKK